MFLLSALEPRGRAGSRRSGTGRTGRPSASSSTRPP